MVKKQIKVSHKRPIGVTILSVLSFIGAAFTLLFGLMMFFGSAFVGPMIARMAPQYTDFTSAGIALVIFMGIILIAFAVLDFFIGKGLWNGQNWARIIVLVFAVLAILGAVFPFNIVNLIIGGLIVWYLGFNKTALAYFK